MGNTVDKMQIRIKKLKNKEEKTLGQFTEDIFQGLKPGPSLNLQNSKTINQEQQKNLQQASSFVNQSIITQDRRNNIPNTYVYPFSAIGLLICFDRQGRKVRGTAFLIGFDLLLTCAHNCYDVINGYRYDIENMLFYPALNGTQGQPYRIKDVFMCKDFRYQKDFAVVQLYCFIGGDYGYFGLDFTKNVKKNCMIYGYPIKVKGKSSKLKMYGQSGQIIQNGCFFNYQITTSGGQSGSPIFYEENGKWYVKGVHTQGSQKNILFNRGIVLALIKEDLAKVTSHTVVNMNLCGKSDQLEIRDLFSLAQWNGREEIQKELAQINILDLSKNKLQELPTIFLQSSSLFELDLSQNFLLHLPQQTNNFKLLRSLYLCKNLLTDLPESLRNNRLLENLYIGDNNFTIFPKVVCQLEQLSTLQIQRCKIEQIPSQIEHLQKLNKLFCGQNEIKKIAGFEKKMNVTHIGLSKNKIRDLPQEPSRMGLFGSVEKLYLQDNKIERIPKMITLLQKIKYLDLKGNLISQLHQCYFNKELKVSLERNPLNFSDSKLIAQLQKRQFHISY